MRERKPFVTRFARNVTSIAVVVGAVMFGYPIFVLIIEPPLDSGIQWVLTAPPRGCYGTTANWTPITGWWGPWCSDWRTVCPEGQAYFASEKEKVCRQIEERRWYQQPQSL
jgi:hypothetical protein